MLWEHVFHMHRFITCLFLARQQVNEWRLFVN